MKLRLDEYYYILNINYGWEEIEDYMPDDIADKYLEFCESHNSDEVYDYFKKIIFIYTGNKPRIYYS